MIVVAHAAGGAEIEGLMVAGALLVLSVFFFFEKSVKTMVPVTLLVAAVAVGIGSFALGDDSSASSGSSDATVTITAPEEGETVAADEPVAIEVDLLGAQVASDPGAGPDAGHIHIFVDGELEGMPSSTSTEVSLDPGTHTISVEFVGGNHGSFQPQVIDEIEVTAE